jgi:uncharacterized protein (TIGR02145 family)
MEHRRLKLSTVVLFLSLGLTSLQAQTLKDIEGNVYKTVKIGNQEWMAENLKTTKYNDGSAIPLVAENEVWGALTTPGYCWYNNDEATYKNTYGALYNWYTVNSGNLCPTGWHVPSDADWITLTDFLRRKEGAKLKETGTTHWFSPNTDATNETGFTALPGGDRGPEDGKFDLVGYRGFWWSATESNIGTYYANWRGVVYDDPYVLSVFNPKKSGFSVRCVKD